MSGITLRRTYLTLALLLTAQALFASNPAARTGTRMVYDESAGVSIMFGGETAQDAGTVQVYDPTDTWAWDGVRWLQRYPAHNPPGRSGHIMVYDSRRSRLVIFGGRAGANDLNDTWAYDDNDWSQLNNGGDAPSPRALAGAAYDRDRDRIVLFGGAHTVVATNGTSTVTNYYDTWEFDGTSWTKVADNGPQVIRPLLSYDELRHQMLMVAEDANLVPSMYTYDFSSHTWNQLHPANMPACVNQAGLAYRKDNGSTMLIGGACVTSTYTSSSIEEAWEWDGAIWTEVTTKSAVTRVTNQAITFDAARGVVTEFGGTEAFGGPRSSTYSYDPKMVDTENDPPKFSADWIPHDTNSTTPGPRSLARLEADPTNKVLYLLNGLTDNSSFSDFWKYQNGGWQRIVADKTPSCGTPLTAFDTDRSKLIAVCNDAATLSVSEWDGTAWTLIENPKNPPPFRRFAAMVYDQTLKKTVLFGGWDEANYLNTTWLWDGTNWTEVKNNRPPARALTMMWFDPILKKTVMYGGIGRPNPQDALKRYGDMWSLGSNGWTEIKPASTPGTRYGAQVAVDPRNGHTFLFGGLVYESQTVGKTVTQKQFYANDMWDWDGTTWKPVVTNNVPPARENAVMAFDYGRNDFVLFSGWAGYYLSDLWLLEGDTWHVVPEQSGRRRVVGPRP